MQQNLVEEITCYRERETMSHPSEGSSGGGAVVVIVVVAFILLLVCGGGLVLLGGAVFAFRASPAPIAPPPTVQPIQMNAPAPPPTPTAPADSLPLSEKNEPPAPNP
jgi:hypothetical protein